MNNQISLLFEKYSVILKAIDYSKAKCETQKLKFIILIKIWKDSLTKVFQIKIKANTYTKICILYR